MSRTARVVGVLLIVAAVAIASFSGYVYFNRRSTGVKTPVNSPTPGYPAVFNATPASSTILNNTTYLNGNQALLSSYVQLWAATNIGNANITWPYTDSAVNESTIFAAESGPSGVANGNVSLSFANVLSKWQHFLTETNQQKSEPSLAVAVSYTFYYNTSYDEQYSYNGFIPYNPFSFNLSRPLTFDSHPNLTGYPHQYIPAAAAASAVSTANPAHLPGCTGYVYGWTLRDTNSTYNVQIPLAFDNDTSSTQLVTFAVALGIANAYVHFSAQKGYDNNNTYSFVLGTQGSWNPYNTVGGTSLTLYPASVNATRTLGYIYVIGNITADHYQRWKESCATGQKTWYNSYYTSIFIDSLNQHNGTFDIGSAYDGYNQSSPFSNQSAISTFGFFNYSNKLDEGNIAPQNQFNWSAVGNSLGTSYGNLWGTVNGLIGLGIAYIGALMTIGVAGGWIPGDGWAETAGAVLAITGFTSAVVSFFLSGVVTGSSSVIVYVGWVKNVGTTQGQNGNPVDLQLYQFTTQIAVSGTDYLLPTFWMFDNAA